MYVQSFSNRVNNIVPFKKKNPPKSNLNRIQLYFNSADSPNDEEEIILHVKSQKYRCKIEFLKIFIKRLSK